jgi:hypothetical protein
VLKSGGVPWHPRACVCACLWYVCKCSGCTAPGMLIGALRVVRVVGLWFCGCVLPGPRAGGAEGVVSV